MVKNMSIFGKKCRQYGLVNFLLDTEISFLYQRKFTDTYNEIPYSTLMKKNFLIIPNIHHNSILRVKQLVNNIFSQTAQ